MHVARDGLPPPGLGRPPGAGRLDATAEAAPDTPTETAPEQTTRGWRISRQLTVWTILVPLVAVLAGALFSASSGAAQGTDLRSAAGGIPDLIREETRRGEIRAREVARLHTEVDDLTERRRSRDEQVAIIIDGRIPSPGIRHGRRRGTGCRRLADRLAAARDQIPSFLRYDDLVVTSRMSGGRQRAVARRCRA